MHQDYETLAGCNDLRQQINTQMCVFGHHYTQPHSASSEMIKSTAIQLPHLLNYNQQGKRNHSVCITTLKELTLYNNEF